MPCYRKDAELPNACKYIYHTKNHERTMVKSSLIINIQFPSNTGILEQRQFFS